MTDNQQALEGIVDMEYLVKACEAVLFACGSAVTFDRIAISVGASPKEIPEALSNLKNKYAEMGSAIELLIFDDSAQLVTKGEFGDIVRIALELRKNQPLSRAALEVLAIVAFNQPVTRAFIDRVRGVESPSVVSSLSEKRLIEEVGRLDAPGHPILYGTTSVFLRTFGLSSINDLNELPELEEIRQAFVKDGEQQEMDIGDGKLIDDGEDKIEVSDEIPAEGVIFEGEMKDDEQIAFDDENDE